MIIGKQMVAGAQTITKVCNIILKIAAVGIAVDPKFCFYEYDNSPGKELLKISSAVDILMNPQDLAIYYLNSASVAHPTFPHVPFVLL